MTDFNPDGTVPDPNDNNTAYASGGILPTRMNLEEAIHFLNTYTDRPDNRSPEQKAADTAAYWKRRRRELRRERLSRVGWVLRGVLPRGWKRYECDCDCGHWI
ncbi:hypothetical protein AB0383_20510 [Amycolatopsis sp. NPDC051373]|uniref:hypothetical protein n=1 Tax=Amycolatopsis sp. NPDC051373 TaxID=3155801 RepID=UPI00344DC6B3